MPIGEVVLSQQFAEQGRKRALKIPAYLFITFVCLLLLALQGWARWDARQAHISVTKVATANMAHAVSQHAEDTFRSADTALLGIVDRVEKYGLAPVAIAELRELLVKSTATMPQLQGLFIYDQDGRWVVNSVSASPSSYNNSDREYFIYHRDHPGSAPRIGVPIRSRSTNDWIIPFSRRISHPDGSFAGVVLATVRVAYFTQFYENFNIGREGTIFLALNSGTMMVRRPFKNDVIGRDISNGPVFREYRSKGPVGTAMLKAQVDNIERLYSYRHVGTYPLLVASALTKEDILQEWWEITRNSFLIMSGVVILICMLGYRIIRQIDVRELIEVELRAAQRTLEMQNRSLEVMALQDGLTGLANRRQFDNALQSEFQRAMRVKSTISLIMIDVDHFKRYNDLYGHQAGDECLKKVSTAIKGSLHRGGDLAVRYGGEEFSVLLPETEFEGVLVIAERIRLAVFALSILHEGNETGVVTISVGIKCLNPVAGHDSALELIRGADKALYSAKASGRNCVSHELTALEQQHQPEHEN